MPDYQTSIHGRHLGLDKDGNLVNRGYTRGQRAAFTSLTTAGNVTYTAAQLLSGTIVRDPNGAARTDTLPTAALLVAALNALSGAEVGDLIDVTIWNGSDGAADAETITIAAGTGGTFDAAALAASRIVRTGSSKIIRIRITNVTAGAEAYAVCA
jgi:hypothetical protein